jgi:hypothetical protein
MTDPGTRPRRGPAVAGAIASTLFVAAAVVAAWLLIGPTGFVFAWVAHFLLMFWASTAVACLTTPLNGAWFRVRDGEPQMYRRLGVHLFAKGLDIVGWNRMIARSRSFDGTRGGLVALDQDTRRSELGHLACLAVSLPLAILAAGTGSAAGALWLTGLAILLHAYPVALQRAVRARIQRLVPG